LVTSTRTGSRPAADRSKGNSSFEPGPRSGAMRTRRSRRCCEAGAVPACICASSCCSAAPIERTLRKAFWKPRLVSICSISTPSRLAIRVTPFGWQSMRTVIASVSPDAVRRAWMAPVLPGAAGSKPVIS
jgi:hypothetical protein